MLATKNSSRNVLKLLEIRFIDNVFPLEGIFFCKYQTRFTTFQNLIVIATFNAFWVVSVNAIPWLHIKHLSAGGPLTKGYVYLFDKTRRNATLIDKMLVFLSKHLKKCSIK